MTPEQIAEHLGQAIREKEFAPGDPLIQEDLARRFKVSRNPVREALRMLAADGLVTITQGSGATVRKRSVEELNELYDVRLVLELQIAPHIVEGATGRALAELRDLVQKMESAATVQEWMRFNYRFHSLVYSLAGRPYTEVILRGVFSAVQPYSLENVEKLGGRPRSDRAHEEMIDAIERRDGAQLADLFREHLERTRDRLQELYRERADDDSMRV